MSDIKGQVLTLPHGEPGRVILPPQTNSYSDRSSATILIPPTEHACFICAYIQDNRLYLKFNDPLDLEITYARNNTLIRVTDQHNHWPTDEERAYFQRGRSVNPDDPRLRCPDSQGNRDSQERNQNSQVNDSQAPQDSQDSQARNPDPDPDSAAPSSPEDQDEEALFEDDCAPTEALSSVEHHLSDRSEVTWDCKLADASYQEEQDNLRYAKDLQQAIENSLPIPTVIVTHKSKPTAATDALSSAPTATTPP